MAVASPSGQNLAKLALFLAIAAADTNEPLT